MKKSTNNKIVFFFSFFLKYNTFSLMCDGDSGNKNNDGDYGGDDGGGDDDDDCSSGDGDDDKDDGDGDDDGNAFAFLSIRLPAASSTIS